jgi:hypothetical protein
MSFEGCSSPVSKNAIYDLYCSYFTLFLTKLSYQILVTTTKRNVTENLTYPLLEISVGLNIFLASANQAMDIDEAGRKNLSRIALACNMAVNALDDMAYSNNIFAAPTETGKKRRKRREEERTSYLKLLFDTVLKPFVLFILSSSLYLFNHGDMALGTVESRRFR